MMKAFIYAAGRATRLGAEFAKKPKILIEIGGRTLLEWHAMRLAENGIREIAVITGHERAQIAETLPLLETKYGVKVNEIFNPDFTEGSVLSFHISMPEALSTGKSVLLMDGDVFYPTELLESLIKSPHPTALLVDRHFSTTDDDPVLVPMRGGRPFEFLKRWRGEAEQLGESIGFFKTSPADLQFLAEDAARRSVGQGRLDSYDEVLRAGVKAGRFHAEDITGLPWTEVDFPADVEYARDYVLPTILKETAKPRD